MSFDLLFLFYFLFDFWPAISTVLNCMDGMDGSGIQIILFSNLTFDLSFSLFLTIWMGLTSQRFRLFSIFMFYLITELSVYFILFIIIISCMSHIEECYVSWWTSRSPVACYVKSSVFTESVEVRALHLVMLQYVFIFSSFFLSFYFSSWYIAGGS